MSLKKNTIANYVGSFYFTIAGILVVPFYLKLLGNEAFGLIGFFTMLQSWLHLLDLGLSPTLSREVAKYRAGANSAEYLRTLVRSLEYFFFLTALIVFLVLLLFCDWLAHSWLKFEQLDFFTLKNSIMLMSITVPLRWILAFYRSGLTGMEKHVWLNIQNVIFTTLRTFGAVIVLKAIGASVIGFFGYQTIIVILEGVILVLYFYKNLPITSIKPCFSFSAFRKIFPFAGSLAFTSSVWLVVAQVDKLILSNRLSLSEYGYFTMAIRIASSISLFSGPISKVLLPRMTFLASQGKDVELEIVYRKATQFIFVVAAAFAGSLAVNAQPLLFAWVGDTNISSSAGGILFWYALGNGILSIMAFQYYLQFSYGQLKYHLKFNIFFAIFWAPFVSYFALNYGAIAAGKCWFFCQLLIFIFWTWFIHEKFLPGLHKKWLFVDIMPVFLATLSFCFFSRNFLINFVSLPRLNLILWILFLSILNLIVNALASSACREQIFRLLKKGGVRDDFHRI